MTHTNGKSLNPWISMWTQPRATMQQIVDKNLERLVLVLASISGFSQVLDRASMRSAGDWMEWPLIFLAAAIAGPIVGLVGLYIGGAVIHWTGGWMGGNASPQNIRAALAWSSIPIIWCLILWVPELALFGQELFTSEMPIIEANSGLLYTFVGFAVIETIIGIWAIFTSLKCLAQVQDYSAWHALANVILSGLVIVVPLAIIFFVIVSFTL